MTLTQKITEMIQTRRGVANVKGESLYNSQLENGPMASFQLTQCFQEKMPISLYISIRLVVQTISCISSLKNSFEDAFRTSSSMISVYKY